MTPAQGAAAGLSAAGCLLGVALAWVLFDTFAAAEPCTLPAPCGTDVASLGPGGAARLWGMTLLQLAAAFAAAGGLLGFIVSNLINKRP